ncbi:hypothetical protein [Kribbella sp. NPDC023855]|uniref:hypothetical protein n=1 Tax=Kribbella sp. NPDC023855 TaxID=3154698 RepID=UPI00340B03D3
MEPGLVRSAPHLIPSVDLGRVPSGEGWDHGDDFNREVSGQHYSRAVVVECDGQGQFTELYGRFLGGGVKKWGAPIVLDLAPDPSLDLLVNHQWFSERTDNVEWTERLNGWLDAARGVR